MAKVLLRPQVGDLAYPHGTPMQVFKITKVNGVVTNSYYSRGKVEGVNRKGEPVKYDAILLKCFATLQLDHQRKADKFKQIMNSFKESK